MEEVSAGSFHVCGRASPFRMRLQQKMLPHRNRQSLLECESSTRFAYSKHPNTLCSPLRLFKTPLTHPPLSSSLLLVSTALRCLLHHQRRAMETVIVFDFDMTIIDCDSDPWVIDRLGASHLFHSLLPTLPWNPLMDKMMGELHAQGTTIHDIQETAKTVPLYPEMIRAIKFAFSLGCDLRIVSDANIFFIKTILESHDLLQYFTDIKTNPAFVDEDGRLRIGPFHPYAVPPHGCNLCPPNMCKGAVIDGIQKSFDPELKKRLIYVGDGKGDFCPSLRLDEEDHVLARKDYPLWMLLHQNIDLVKAEVHEWGDAKDVENLLYQLLKSSADDLITHGEYMVDSAISIETNESLSM